MRKALTITLLTVVMFAVLTFFTAQEDLPVDGNNIYGFPLRFYIEYGGKRIVPMEEPSHFNYLNLSFDILFAIIVAAVLYLGVNRLAKRRRLKKV